MDLCSYTEQLWHFYLTEEWTEKAAAFLQTLDEDIVVIGTGKHEFYESLAVFRKALQREEQERSEIHFTIESVSSKEKKVLGGCPAGLWDPAPGGDRGKRQRDCGYGLPLLGDLPEIIGGNMEDCPCPPVAA